MNARNRPTPAQQTNLSGNYAGFISRTMAFILATVFCTLMIIGIFWLSSITDSLFQISRLLGLIVNYFPAIKPVIDFLYSNLFHGIIAAFIIILYQSLFIFFAGQTPAKRLIGLRVVSYHHKRIPLWRAVFRYLGYYISALPFGLGFLWILIDDRRMAWHDKLAGTCVLYAWDAQPDETFLVRVTQLLTSRQAAMEELRKQRRRLSSFLHKDEKNKISSDAVFFLSSAAEESHDTEEDSE